MKYILLLFVASILSAQELPDTPQPQAPPPVVEKHCGPHWLGGCWDYSRPTLSVKKTFTNPNWVVTTVAADAAYAIDAWKSREAIERGCIEGNTDLPPRATAADYAKNWALKEAPMDGLAWMLTKLHRPILDRMVDGMAIARIVVHGIGTAQAIQCR